MPQLPQTDYAGIVWASHGLTVSGSGPGPGPGRFLNISSLCRGGGSSDSAGLLNPPAGSES